MSNDLSKVFKDGILVDVNVSFWSGAKALTPDDLGLDPSSLPDAYRLGKKFLIPAEVIHKFRAVEGRARRVVEENSFPFPIGNARFVPKRKFGKVVEALKEHQTDYKVLIEDLINNYEKYRCEMIPIYKAAAEQAFDVAQPTGVQTFGIDDREAEKTNYVNTFLTRIYAYYPQPESLRNKFALDWAVYEVAMPMLKEGDTSLILANQELEQEMINTAKTKIHSFVDDVVKSLRAETVELCSKVVTSIKEGKVIKGQTIKSLRNFVERFQELNFVGDSTVEEELNKLKSEFLDSHTYEEIAEGDLQFELQKRLQVITDMAANESDLSDISGGYKRQINWVTEPIEAVTIETTSNRHVQWDHETPAVEPAPEIATESVSEV
jgi:hypothetical protein